MAEEVLVAADLTSEAIEGGERLLRALDDRNVVVDAALWLFSPESSSWKLMIAAPEFRALGPKRLYRRIQSVLAGLDAPKPDLSDVTVVDSQDGLVQLLRVLTNTGRTVNRIRLKRTTVNGVSIPDVHIYRVA